jgi:hypothetical protein
VDETDKVHEEWNTEKTEQVRLDGKLYYQWDRELLNAVNASRIRAGKEPLERFGSSHPDPELDEAIKMAGGVFEDVPYKEIYKTFDSFVRDYHGYRLESKGRYGYYHNPNAKWDWWQIGGRWTGHWPAKKDAEDVGIGDPGLMTERAPEGRVDVIRIRNIDMALAEQETEQMVEKFLKEYAAYYENGKEPEGSHPWSGPRSDGVNLGLILCLNEDEISDKMRVKGKLEKWPHQIKEGVDRFDVILPLPEGDELEKFKQFLRDHFNHLRTYAYLDPEKGWVEPGTMGWWASTDATPETRKEYSQGFMDWLRSGNQDDWIVSVDCHI